MSSDLHRPIDFLHWIALARSPRIGPSTFFALLSQLGSARAAYEHVSTFGLQKTQSLSLLSLETAEKELALIHTKKASLLFWGHAGYPELLMSLNDPPPLLTLFGNTDLLLEPACSIVGARNASLNGLHFTKQLACDLSNAGVVIVSGLARGIDTAAHEGALKTGTIAVLAGGADHIYPPENKTLAQNILESGGIILSEMPLGTAPQAMLFPRRNRVISGLSIGLIVVEAGLQSGSLITARFALEQNREVFAVPGFPLDPRSQGGNKLIKEGATLLEKASDFLDPFRFPKRAVDRTSSTLSKEPSLTHSDHSHIKTALLQALSTTPQSLDELVRALSFPPSWILLVSLELELEGEVERLPGQRLVRIFKS